MRLSKRIYAIADAVNKGETAADIETDHGYVPMLLIKNAVSPRVIMSDISEGSLAKAVETFRLCGLDADPEDFRTGDGLDTIEPGEVDTVIIAGLGGHTIADILTADIHKSMSFKRLILQPRKHSGNLRYALYTNGWDISDEILAPEGKFVCEIICAVPGEGIQPGLLREAPYPEEDIRWKYPEAIVKADRELAAKRIAWKTGSITEEIENLKRSSHDRDDLIRKLIGDRDYLEKLI
jgi:tRNA (adenine22-N1)-methyltransferase